MEEINCQTMPNFGLFLWTILIGLVVIGLYKMIKKISLPVLASGNSKEKILRRVDYLEKVCLPIFIIILGISLILSHTLIGVLLCLFTAGILWKTINNYFLGLIYQVDNNYKMGQRIRYNTNRGTIKRFNNLSLEMELEGGEFLDIPYSHFANTEIIRTSPQSGIMGYAINIPIAKPCDLEKEKRRIKNKLLSLPWVLPNQKIVFEHGAEEVDCHQLKVTVQGVDKKQLYKVENSIRRMY